jgi:transcriptional regulator with XRE-family HTH domain
MSNDLGEALRRERRRRKERQIDTASRFGISQPSYARWESGEHDPDDQHFGAIADFTGLALSDVWRMVHHSDAEPLTVDKLQERLLHAEQDWSDVRKVVAATQARLDRLLAELDEDRQRREEIDRRITELASMIGEAAAAASQLGIARRKDRSRTTSDAPNPPSPPRTLAKAATKKTSRTGSRPTNIRRASPGDENIRERRPRP